MNRSLSLAFAATFAIACGTATPMNDASTADAATDTMATPDVQMTAETGAETGGSRDFGTCGMSLHACLCACPSGDQACQQMCLGSSSMGCQQCVGMAQAQCCPTESGAVGMCAQMNMCGDIACVNMNCGSQIQAFNACIMAQAMMPACQMRVAACVGTDNVCP